MIPATWTTFTDSRKSPTTETTVAKSIALPTENSMGLLESKTIAALTFRTPDGKIQHVYRPRLLPSSDGSPPSKAYGNVFNQQGLLGPIEIKISPFRFCGLLSETDMDAFDLEKPTAIPAGLHNLGEGNFYLVTAPKAMLGYFHQKFPDGQLTDIQDELEKNGIGFAVWSALHHSADSQAKVDAIRAIYQHPTIQDSLDSYLAFGSTDVGLSGPALTAEWNSLEFYPEQLEDLMSAFTGPSVPASGSPVPVAQQALTTNKDLHEMKVSEKGLIKLQLPFVGANIVNNRVDASSVTRPSKTIALTELEKTPPSGKKDSFSDMLQCYLQEQKSSVDATQVTEHCSICHIPLPICDTIVKGLWPLETTADRSAQSQMNNMGISTFQPQDPSNNLIELHKKEEASDRTQNKSEGVNSRTLKAMLSTVVKMTDDFAPKSLINAIHVFGTLFDFKKMTRDGTRCLFEGITMDLIKWFLHQATVLFPKWRVQTGEKMPWLGALLCQWAELEFVCFGKFSNSLHNRDTLNDPAGDLRTLDFSVINDFLTDLETFKKSILSMQRTMTPHNAPPALFLAANMPSVSIADEAPRQPAPVQVQDDRGSRDNRASRQQQQPPRGQNDDQGLPKRQKPTPSSNGPREQRARGTNGILCLRDGTTLNEAFPPSFPACKKHVTRDFICTFGDNCSAAHWSTLREAPSRHRTAWIDHLRSKPVAYFNKWKLGQGLSESDPELQGIAGPLGSPPPRVVREKEAVLQQPNRTIPSNIEENGPGYNSSRFFSAPPIPASQSVSQPLRLPTIPPPSQAGISQATQQISCSNEDVHTTVTDKLIRNAKHANQVLDEYTVKYGGTTVVPIVATLQGKKRKRTIMPARLTASYRALNLTFELIVLPLLASGYLDWKDYGVIEQVNQRLGRLVPKHLYWSNIDTSSLREQRLDYANQKRIDPHRVDMASAQFIRSGGDPDKLVRFCSQEYILAHLDRQGILKRIKEHISTEDFDHIDRILYDGCPAELSFDEENQSRLRSLERGNQPTYLSNPTKVLKAINKEDKNSHLIPLDEDLAYFSPFCRHTPQGAIDKAGKSFRIVWDGSTKQRYNDVVLNDVTPTEKEAPVTFGTTESSFDKDIYDYRVSYPTKTIYLGFEDITSCYKFGRLNPGLSGAFGFFDSQGLYHLATSMVFGSTISANQWEPFRRSIEILSKAFQDVDGLVEKHQQYLDMIQWDENVPAPSVIAKGCAICPGVLDTNGNHVTRPARMYVDDALLAAITRYLMERKLVATIEAIFSVMGYPDESRRRNPLSLEKWTALKVSPYQTVLGLYYDTVNLTKGTTLEYRIQLLAYLDEHWPITRTSFTAHDMQILVGKIARLAKGARWVFHILSHSYDQIALALASNYQMLNRHSSQFKTLISCIKKGQMGKSKLSQDSGRLVAFALKQASQLVHRSRHTYGIFDLLREDIEFFRHALHTDSGIPWSSPLAHVVFRTPIGIPFGDACLTGCGGYCTELKFWWHIELPPDIVNRTLRYLANDSANNLISINALEFVTVILSYCAALSVIAENDLLADDPFPVILCMTDNTSALNWINHRCKGSMLGRALGRLFVGLIMDSPLGINAAWLNTHDNEIADGISRFKTQSTNVANEYPTFDYSLLKQKYKTTLSECQLWSPSSRLTSLIYTVLTTRRSPSLKELRSLKPHELK